MKFIHTSNWQLGMSFSHVFEKADDLRKARIDAVKQLVALAEKEKVDFVIAAGDLFEDNRVAQETIEQMAAVVCASPVPVYLVAGCRDPLTQDSPLVRCKRLFKDSAIVLRTPKSVAVPGGTLYPCPITTRSGIDDPAEWIPDRSEEDGIRIGIANANIGKRSGAEPFVPQKVAALRELDYMALGHCQGAKKIDDNTWYCGPPEPFDFGQPDAGKTLLVEIAEAGAAPVVREVSIYTYTWCEMESQVNSCEDVDQLVDDIHEMSDPQMLLRVRVTGTVNAELAGRIDKISSERFFHFDMSNGVAVAEGTREYRHPLLRQMVAQLVPKTRGDGEEAAIARRALQTMSAFVNQAGFPLEEV